MILSSHYRRPIDYGPARLDEIARGFQAFEHFFERFERLTGDEFRSPLAAATTKRRPGVRVANPSGFTKRSLRFASGSSTPWTTTSTPEVPSANSSTWSAPFNRYADVQRLELSRDAARLEELRAGTVVLKELAQIPWLFRRPSPRRPPPSTIA